MPDFLPIDPLARDFDACDAHETPADPYDALLARLAREHVPVAVLWELTHRCNLECVMCYNAPQDQPELSTAECMDVLEQLAAAGTLQLTFTGGEILTRRDFFPIARRARELGFALDLKTNGTMLTPRLADQVAALTPVQVELSLLGATDATFDAVAQSRGALQRLVRGIRLLQERGVRVKLNTLLLERNIAERQQMVELAFELGANYAQTFRVSRTDDGRVKAGDQQLTREEITRAMIADQMPFRSRQVTPEARTCRVGQSSCLISPYGLVYPCIELRIPAGNLRTQRFADIWSAPIFRELAERHVMANLPDCLACPINTYCDGRCAGLAWKEHGDPYGGHTLACHQAQARYAVEHPGLAIPETPLLARQRAGAGAQPRTTQPISLLE